MSYEELCALLGVTEHILQGTDVRVKFKNDEELILSPSRKKRRFDSSSMTGTRPKAATPTMEDNPTHNESVMSGYDGDHEDDLEDSFFEFDGMCFLSKSFNNSNSETLILKYFKYF